jgi:hypothetical protein
LDIGCRILGSFLYACINNSPILVLEVRLGCLGAALTTLINAVPKTSTCLSRVRSIPQWAACAAITLISFVYILWDPAGALTIFVGSAPITLPGYLVWAVRFLERNYPDALIETLTEKTV